MQVWLDRGRLRTTAALVVEVADDSLRRDGRVKARVYARASITDYWTVNVMTADERIVPLAAPFCSIAIADLLP